MMRGLITVSLFAAVTAAAGAAQAQVDQTQSEQMVYNGTVQPGCIMALPTVPSSENATATSITPGSASILVTRLVGDDGVPLGAQLVLNMESACNQAHVLSIGSQNGALVNADSTGAPGGTFRNTLPYSVSLSWAGQSQTFDSGDTALDLPIGDAARGPVVVTIQIPAGGAPMVAGSYSDQLVLELGVAG